MNLIDRIIDAYYAVRFKLEDLAYAAKYKFVDFEDSVKSFVPLKPVKSKKKTKAKKKKK
jgi:hypothetical protein